MKKDKNPYLICLETSSTVCSICLIQGMNVLISKNSYEKNSHAKNINIFIEEVLAKSGINLNSLSGIVVSGGPGSYTGLRIGVSTAKGLCFGLNIPLIVINTLDSMLSTLKKEILRFALIHARENEFYVSAIDKQGNKIIDSSIIIIDEHFFNKYNEDFIVVADKVSSIGMALDNLMEQLPLATHLAIPAFQKWVSKDFTELSDFEPIYIKPFLFRQKINS